MSLIGAFGPVPFIASEKWLNTFSNLQRKRKASYVEHRVIGSKPKLEMDCEELDTITFEMRFDTFRGIAPTVQLPALNLLMSKGLPLPLVIGTHYFGMFVIEELDETFPYFDGKGVMLSATVKISIKEYVF